MIRALLIFSCTAVPASAQDFHGLTPGMPPSALAALGESLSYSPFGGDDPLTEAVYPLPYGQRLQVYFTPERILSLTTWGDPVELTLRDAPVTGGLQTFTTTLGDAIAMAGSEGMYFEARGQFEAYEDQRTWWLVYEVPAMPDMLLELQFMELNATDEVTVENGFAQFPLDVPLAQAALYHPEFLTTFPNTYGTTLTSRPGAAPFAAALSEAFPFIEIPQ